MIKILMIGRPGGNLERTYDWHIEALNNDEKNRFILDCLHKKGGNVDVTSYDIFWFYAKAFNPEIYHKIKEFRPDAKIVCGPNVLLDKPDVGLSDDWDVWYSQQCRPDVHLDQVTFYSNHVKKFLSDETKKVAKVLDKCIKIDESFYKPNVEKTYDCLLYSKKRRYDYDFEEFRFNLINLLEEANINYCEVPAGKFGSYKREDYFNLLNKSKLMVNLSLDECPGILNYESMFFNVPVVGSPNNVPVNSSENLHVLGTDEMTSKYLVRKEDAAISYFKKIKEVLYEGLANDIDHRAFILEHTSFQRYADRVHALVGAL